MVGQVLGVQPWLLPVHVLLARVNSRERLPYPFGGFLASSTSRVPSVRVSSPPVMGLMPRLPASRANSNAPHKLVSVRARES